MTGPTLYRVHLVIRTLFCAGGFAAVATTALTASALTAASMSGTGLAATAIAAAAFAAASLGAQNITTRAATVPNAEPPVWVLISGIVGGVDGMSRLETVLRAKGLRVITIDPYALSIDSADVTFAALARRVDAKLAGLRIEHAHVVGHAHGGGVALRLAASYPNRVRALDLLDVGALPSSRTAIMGRATRLVPLVAGMPGGRGYIRSKLVDGIRENAGSDAWFNDKSQRAYTLPALDNIGRAAALVQRLSAANEPEDISAVIARINVPVTVVIGEVPHAASVKVAHLESLAPLGERLRIVRLQGVGHFPHEEVPAKLLQILDAVVVVRVVGAAS